MRIKSVLGAACLVAAVVAWPVRSMAATSQSCKAGEPTAQSYKWNFHQEASNLLGDVQQDAVRVADQAALLQSVETDPEVTWQVHLTQLEPIKAEVNDMGQKLCRLETIRRVTAPWQRQAIDRAARHLRLMADNTQDAILFLNDHKNTLWMPTYALYTSNLYNEATETSRSLQEFTEYAKDRTEVHHLKQELRVKSGA